MSKLAILMTLMLPSAQAVTITGPGGWGISLSFCDVFPFLCPGDDPAPPPSCTDIRSDLATTERRICSLDSIAEDCGFQPLFPNTSTISPTSQACAIIRAERLDALREHADLLLQAALNDCSTEGMEKINCR